MCSSLMALQVLVMGMRWGWSAYDARCAVRDPSGIAQMIDMEWDRASPSLK